MTREEKRMIRMIRQIPLGEYLDVSPLIRVYHDPDKKWGRAFRLARIANGMLVKKATSSRATAPGCLGALKLWRGLTTRHADDFERGDQARELTGVPARTHRLGVSP